MTISCSVASSSMRAASFGGGSSISDQAAGLQVGQAGVGVQDRPEDDLVQVGQTLDPVVGELLDRDVIVQHPLDELEGASADRDARRSCRCPAR